MSLRLHSRLDTYPWLEGSIPPHGEGWAPWLATIGIRSSSSRGRNPGEIIPLPTRSDTLSHICAGWMPPAPADRKSVV